MEAKPKSPRKGNRSWQKTVKKKSRDIEKKYTAKRR
jgi:hypothetical protein